MAVLAFATMLWLQEVNPEEAGTMEFNFRRGRMWSEDWGMTSGSSIMDKRKARKAERDME